MRYIFYVIFICILSSCSKEKTFHIIAKNAVTGQGYSGLSYRIIEERQGSFESKSKKIEEGTLNDDGEKLIAVKMKKNRIYKVLVDLPVNTCYHNELSYYSFNSGNTIGVSTSTNNFYHNAFNLFHFGFGKYK